ncbi:MAG: hypothetical protein RBG1_1C00001G0658 [candidate division Zixibacteria bacterium RBG-1]|nr:MAG: hypothetical protein RBG1_1C00001G0658 [candidate division Zixibacteria bacterium RBG-1]OGC85896.1 MAG: hypothetical protein A2V73_08060 [candidate division Zixibacteria bacterium RBG_19FT_COMBO_42_43]
MQKVIYRIGFWSALIAFVAAAGYSVAQILQLLSVTKYPLDAILIFGFALGIEVPFMLAFVALHYTVPDEKKIWTHAALLFSIMYATYVTLNYVVQLATVIPMTLKGALDEIRVLDQTPHSLFWDVDALGYIFLGLATLFAVPVFAKKGFERWVKWFFLANSLMTPVIAFVYFYPHFSTTLLLFGSPWLVTASGSMLLLALFFSKKL